MSELVDMLRTPTGCDAPSKWELAAAARIEALEAALRKIMDCEELDAFTLQDIARAALAPEQDR